MNRKQITMLVILSLLLLLGACKDDNEFDGASYDTYQEDSRQSKSNGLEYELLETTHLFSNYQSANLDSLQEDNTTLVFNGQADVHYLPAVGDIYVCMERTKQLPDGFIGRVISCDKENGQYLCRTEAVPLSMAFSDLKCDYQIGISEGDTSGEKESSQKPQWGNTGRLNSGDSRVDFTGQADFTFDFNKKEEALSFDLHSNVTVSNFIHIEGDMLKQHFCFEMTPSLSFTGSYKFEAQKSIGFDETKRELGAIPLTANMTNPLFTPSLLMYGYCEVGGDLKVEGNIEYSTDITYTMTYDKGQWSYDIPDPSSASGEIVGINKISGSITPGIGLRFMTGIKVFNHTLADLDCAYVDIAAKYDCSFEYQQENFNRAYNLLEPIEASLDLYVTPYFELDASLLGGEEYVLTHEFSFNLLKKHVVPKFDNLTYSLGDDVSVGQFSCYVDNELVLPVQVGYILCDAQDNEIGAQLVNQFSKPQDFDNPMQAVFTGLRENKEYKLYPYVQLWNLKIKGEPCLEFTVGKETSEEFEPDEDRPTVNDNLDYSHGNAVDLGLSVLWADRNLGASSPRSDGGLYGWGDPTGTHFENPMWSKCYKGDPSLVEVEFNEEYYRRVAFYGGLRAPSEISNTWHDVAREKWGDGWRLPTQEEMQELINNCDMEIGDDGILVHKAGSYDKESGTWVNDNPIFIPFVNGLWDDDYSCYINGINGKGKDALLMTGSLYGFYEYKALLVGHTFGIKIGNMPRLQSLCSVRPVKDKIVK